MKTVYIDGTFDLLHSGHVKILKKLKEENDILIVGVISDENVEMYMIKPIIHLQNRCFILNEMECVDIVVPDCPFGGITREFIDKYKITKVVYAGEKDTWKEHYGVAIEMGIMEYIDYSHDELSTTKIINRIKYDISNMYNDEREKYCY